MLQSNMCPGALNQPPSWINPAHLVNVQRKVQEVISGSVLLLLISCLCLVFSDNVHIKHIPNDEVNESLWPQSSGFALRFMDLINFFYVVTAAPPTCPMITGLL